MLPHKKKWAGATNTAVRWRLGNIPDGFARAGQTGAAAAVPMGNGAGSRAAQPQVAMGKGGPYACPGESVVWWYSRWLLAPTKYGVCCIYGGLRLCAARLAARCSAAHGVQCQRCCPSVRWLCWHRLCQQRATVKVKAPDWRAGRQRRRPSPRLAGCRGRVGGWRNELVGWRVWLLLPRLRGRAHAVATVSCTTSRHDQLEEGSGVGSPEHVHHLAIPTRPALPALASSSPPP